MLHTAPMPNNAHAVAHGSISVALGRARCSPLAAYYNEAAWPKNVQQARSSYVPLLPCSLLARARIITNAYTGTSVINSTLAL